MMLLLRKNTATHLDAHGCRMEQLAGTRPGATASRLLATSLGGMGVRAQPEHALRSVCSPTAPSAEIKEQEGTKHIAKEDEDEDEKEEDEDKDDTGDEDEDEDEDEDSDEGDEEASCGAAGEQEGVGDGKSAADVLIVGEEKSQHHNEDGKRGSEGVNDAPMQSQYNKRNL